MPGSHGEPEHSRLVQLLDEQARLWQEGKPVLVEAYLKRFPDLASSSEAVLDLVYNEVVERTRRGEKPRLDEYLQRFPHLADALRDHFEVHSALEAESALSLPTTLPAPAGVVQPAVGLVPNLPEYEILGELGRGGMGVVFKAQHRLMRRFVALKVLRPDLMSLPGAIERFQREVRTVARLVHPNIVTAYTAHEVEGLHCLAMEFVAGISLDRLVQQRGPLPVALACASIRQATLGLQHAHEMGIVHRDLKPQNLMLASPPLSPTVGERGRGEGAGVIKILDFGLARIAHDATLPSGQTQLSSLTGTNLVLGTPDYLAPEQAANASAVDIRSDLYSLGCTLYFLLTGRPPFPGGTALSKILRHQNEAPAPVESLRPDVPPGLRLILQRLLAKRPEDRFETPAALAEALLPFTGSPPTSPVPRTPVPEPAPSPGPVVRGRRRMMGVVLLALGLIVLAGGAFFWWGIPRPAGTTPEGRGVGTTGTLAVDWEPKGKLQLCAWGEVFGLAFSPTGDRLVATAQVVEGEDDPGWIKVYDTQTWKPTAEWEEKGVRRAAFGRDGKRLILSFGHELRELPGPGRIRFLDPPFPEKGTSQRAHPGGIRAMAVSPSGKLVATGGNDHTAKLWDVETGECVATLGGEHTGLLTSVAFSSESKLLATGSADATVRVWDVAGRKLVKTLSPPNQAGIEGVAFALNDRMLVATTFLQAQTPSQVLRWDLPGWESRPAIEHGQSYIFATTLAPDGKTLLTGCQDGSFQMFDVERGQRVGGWTIPNSAIRCIVVAPDGGTLAVGAEMGTVHLWVPKGR